MKCLGLKNQTWNYPVFLVHTYLLYCWLNFWCYVVCWDFLFSWIIRSPFGQSPILTMSLTHLCKVVTSSSYVLPAVSWCSYNGSHCISFLLYTLLITCIMFRARSIRTYLSIIGSWDGLVNTEKLVEAARTVDATWLHSVKATFC